METELEQLVGEIYSQIKDVPDDYRVYHDLKFKELKEVLKRTADFIDYCKFEFGEDITKE
jgi:hypothetical protein